MKAKLDYLLARALVATHGDRQRASALADEAAAWVAKADKPDAWWTDDARPWLKERK